MPTRALVPALVALLLASATIAAAAEDAPTFEQLIENAEPAHGFLDLYRTDDHLYLAIPPDRLERPFLVVPRIARGIGAKGLHANQIYDRLEAEVVRLVRHGGRVFLEQLPHRFTADAGSPEAVMVERSFGASVLAAAGVAAERVDGTLLVDIRDWVVSDLFDVERWVAAALGKDGQPAAVSLDAERSYLVSAAAFPRNLEIRVQLTFRPARPEVLDSVPDGRFVPITLQFSWIDPPPEPLVPRLADDRIGSTLSVRKDYSRHGDAGYFVRLANRWRLEPGAPDPSSGGARFFPEQPIVFYLDHTIPEIYRPYVAAGIEAWNTAFEAAGFAGAVRAEPLPEDADPADIRYPTVTWVASAESTFGAFGNSIADPRTGEILDADVVIDAGYIERVRGQRQALIQSRSDTPAAAAAGRSEHDGFGDQLMQGAALLQLALRARGEAPAPMDVVGQAIAHVVLHEVGHDLGLDHNFRASSATPLDRLHDRDYTGVHGIAASVMDYLPINLAPLGTPNGDYFQVAPGPYDHWAIAALYTPDAAQGRALLRQNAEGYKAYAGDTDLYAPGAVDPRTAAWDLSDDLLGWSRQRLDLLRQLLPRLPAIVLIDDAPYADLSDAVDVLGWHYWTALEPVVRMIGGLEVSRDHVGDPAGRKPWVPVPRARQQAALAALADDAFGADAFAIPPAVAQQIGPQNWEHWGFETTYEGRIDPPILAAIAAPQRRLLGSLLDPLRLARLLDIEMSFGSDATLTIPELMSGIAQAVWREVLDGEPAVIAARRRELQRAWLDRMGRILVTAEDAMPADARAVARATLIDVDQRIGRTGASPDAYSRAHLAEVRARIGALLAAQLTLAAP